ncbi:DUF6325 family protein [Cellulomonas hominis]
MTDPSTMGSAMSTVGPVDTAVLVFDGAELSAELAPQLLSLHTSGDVRILDLALVRRTVDGTVVVGEVEDSPVAAAFEPITRTEVDLLSDEELAEVAAALAPGTTALVVVWENTWHERLAAAAASLGGRLAALERIPHDTVVAALAALDEE